MCVRERGGGGKQTDRQTERQRNKQTDRQTECFGMASNVPLSFKAKRSQMFARNVSLSRRTRLQLHMLSLPTCRSFSEQISIKKRIILILHSDSFLTSSQEGNPDKREDLFSLYIYDLPAMCPRARGTHAAATSR